MTVSDLPQLNASLNATSGVLLLAAYACIRARRVPAHAYLMIAAVVCSLAFLTSYLVYHFNVGHKSMNIPAGWFRTSYLIMLASHVLLAMVMAPMICVTLFRAYRRRWDKHLRMARPTFWVWLYVSVTGVLIYVILYHVVPARFGVSN